jgi:GT2 family glycosyltransferase
LDGSTYKHLKFALESIKNQSHQDYKVFLIGDDYSNHNELMELSKIIDDDKIYVQNLPIAIERIKYNGVNLWRVGGINASNIGIKQSLKEGYNYICHLDHDDYYLKNHLQLISECIETTSTNFIATRCGKYPIVNSVDFYIKYRPLNSRLYKVSTCINYSYFNFIFRNMIEECNRSYPADADMWDRINKYLTDKNEYGYLINVETCVKTPDGETYRNPKIIK